MCVTLQRNMQLSHKVRNTHRNFITTESAQWRHRLVYRYYKTRIEGTSNGERPTRRLLNYIACTETDVSTGCKCHGLETSVYLYLWSQM